MVKTEGVEGAEGRELKWRATPPPVAGAEAAGEGGEQEG